LILYLWPGKEPPDPAESVSSRTDILIPVDAELAIDLAPEQEAVSLKRIMPLVRAASRLGLVMLDACRNNPFSAKMQHTGRTRAVERGFVRVEPSDNVLVAYAARDGTTASDGNGRNSPFTAALLKNIETPGLEIRFLFAKVRDEVMTATNRTQQPFTYQSLPAQEIFLAPPSDPCSGPVTVSFSSRCAAPLTAARERELQPTDSFKECDKCPEMVVVPTGSFTMGSPTSEEGRYENEGPQHRVTFGCQFAVGRFAVTVDEWDYCVADGGCNGYRPPTLNDEGRAPRDRGRYGMHPVINVSWDDAQAYLKWLSGKTGKSYRLLTEAEREYVTRAGTTTPFWWGNSISTQQANYSDSYELPVDSFQPNSWGLYQVHGNVWEWTQGCWHGNYNGAPADGSVAWTSGGDCSRRVVRGGSFDDDPRHLRAARHARFPSVYRVGNGGFLVGRTLTP
jgi:formylglycine-generating enzyme required for sulfatase activity